MAHVTAIMCRLAAPLARTPPPSSQRQLDTASAEGSKPHYKRNDCMDIRCRHAVIAEALCGL